MLRMHLVTGCIMDTPISPTLTLHQCRVTIMVPGWLSGVGEIIQGESKGVGAQTLTLTLKLCTQATLPLQLAVQQSHCPGLQLKTQQIGDIGQDRKNPLGNSLKAETASEYKSVLYLGHIPHFLLWMQCQKRQEQPPESLDCDLLGCRDSGCCVLVSEQGLKPCLISSAGLPTNVASNGLSRRGFTATIQVDNEVMSYRQGLPLYPHQQLKLQCDLGTERREHPTVGAKTTREDLLSWPCPQVSSKETSSKPC